MTKYLIFISCLLSNYFAQSHIDAFQYNQREYIGSARNLAMGNALFSLGGDISVGVQNPASLGVLNKDMYSITFMVDQVNISSTYVGTNSVENSTKFIIPNIGAVFSFLPENKQSRWRRFQFGIVYNRLKDLNSSSLIRGTQSNDHAFLDELTYPADGLVPGDLPFFDPFGSDVAYQADLIYPYDTVSYTYANDLFYYPEVKQTREIVEKGGFGETSASLSGNFDDIFYFGIQLGIVGGSYDYTLKQSEEALNDSTSFSRYLYTENLVQDVIGFDSKLGIMFRPIDWVKIGVAIHNPFKLKIEETYETSIQARFRNGKATQGLSPINQVTYRTRNTARYLFSLGLTYQKFIALGIGYEMTNYSKMSLHNGDMTALDFTEANQYIKDNFSYGETLNAGLEIKLKKVFALRGGVKLDKAPYINGEWFTSYSGGLGYLNKYVNVDLAFRILNDSYDWYMYPNNAGDFVNSQENRFLINLSLGLRI